MFLGRFRSLLPKKLVDGVALKVQVSQHQLSRLRGYRKLTIHFVKNSKILKISLVTLLAFYFIPYQPTLAIPPIKQSVVKAATDQEQQIDASRLSYPFQLPHPGYLTTGYSSWHPAIDIATGLSMPVRSVAPGKITEVNFGFFGLGHYVVVEHEQSFRSTYGHMGKIYVKNGDSVDANSILGEVGLTGRTTGPHTHLEITKNGVYIDPQTIMPKVSGWPEYAGKAPQGQGNIKETKVAPTATPVKRETPAKPTKLNLLDLGKVGSETKQSRTNSLELNYLSL